MGSSKNNYSSDTTQVMNPPPSPPKRNKQSMFDLPTLVASARRLGKKQPEQPVLDWKEDIEDQLAIQVNNDMLSLLLFKAVYDSGVTDSLDVLRSLAYLRIHNVIYYSNANEDAEDVAAKEEQSDAVITLASFLMSPDSTKMQKLACLRTLLVVQEDDDMTLLLKDALSFCIGSPAAAVNKRDWSKYQRVPVMDEIRDKCLQKQTEEEGITSTKKQRLDSFQLPVLSWSSTVSALQTMGNVKVANTEENDDVSDVSIITACTDAYFESDSSTCSLDQSSFPHQESSWELDIKPQLVSILLQVMVHGNVKEPNPIEVLHAAYLGGIRDIHVLRSLALLLQVLLLPDINDDNNEDEVANEAIRTVAMFLVDSNVSERSKVLALYSVLATTKVMQLSECVQEEEASTTDLLKDVLTFCTDTDSFSRQRRNWEEYFLKQQDDNNDVNHEQVLLILWEIRAICWNHRILEQRQQHRLRPPQKNQTAAVQASIQELFGTD
jgi:hypothetical protein